MLDKEIIVNIQKMRLPAALIVCAIILTGWSGNWDDIRRESEKIATISARFSQTKKMNILSKPLVSTGSFYFKTPNSVRWEYNAPVKSILLMYQGNIKRYTPCPQGFNEDAGAALQSMNVMLREIMLWNTGRFNESRSFSAELMTGKTPKVMMRPRESSLAKIIAGIEITLAPDSLGVITSIIVNEGEGNTTTFQFSEVKINEGLEDSLFRNPG